MSHRSRAKVPKCAPHLCMHMHHVNLLRDCPVSTTELHPCAFGLPLAKTHLSEIYILLRVEKCASFARSWSASSRSWPTSGSRPACAARWAARLCLKPVLGSEQNYTPDVTKVRFHWKMPLKIHWICPVQIHWESDNPLEHTTDKWNCVGKWHWKFIGKCHWKSTMISEVLMSGVQYFAHNVARHGMSKSPWSLQRWDGQSI